MTVHDNRPPIPTELRRRVLVEAGHRCAIPTCRHIEVEVHHIVPWSSCQKHEYDNLIALCPNCHARADRGDIDKKSLHLYKLNLRFAHDKFSQVEMDVLFSLSKGDDIKWPPFNNILLGRIFEAGLIQIDSRHHDFVSIEGMSLGPSILTITQKGRDFMVKLCASEL